MVCKLPKAGLGNQLFPLLKAFVFGRLNDLPVTVTGYHQVKVGPWLRGEKTKRSYNGFFSFQRKLPLALLQQGNLLLDGGKKLREPKLELVEGSTRSLFLFTEMPHWEDYFAGLREHRFMAIELFTALVRPQILKKVSVLPGPMIGVHIRMGDFRKLTEGEDFASVGAVRTPEVYFIQVIEGIRALHGSDLSVTVFTDGFRGELQQLLTMKNVSIMEGNSDLEDLLLLSRSKIIVTSAGSTFSYWSAFLADAPVIMHPDHIHQPLRPHDTNQKWYEGPFDESNELLRQNIIGIS